MIERTHALPVLQQARLVGIARSSAYYRARPWKQRAEEQRRGFAVIASEMRAPDRCDSRNDFSRCRACRKLSLADVQARARSLNISSSRLGT
ncbi:hypothetical protein KPG66_14675 [Mycetohabitans sp. B2]|nr:hypothetical protein [Mycetohabitans sp. B2]